MKTITTLSMTLLLLAACATGPISERIASKSVAEKNEYLLSKCEDEAWRGHDVGDHHHYSLTPENKAHQANIKKICKELATTSGNKVHLIKQCKTEAGNGTYGGKFVFDKHVANLTEICDAFAAY